MTSQTKPDKKWRFLGESAEYRAARDALTRAEIELRRQAERVAAQRRELPPGPPVAQDYTLIGAAGPLRLSELFGAHDTLVLYHWMYGPTMELPCPMCTSFLDAVEGNARQIAERVALVVAARSPYPRMAAFAAARGWRSLRLVSAAGSEFSSDFLAEDRSGGQNPILYVFQRKDGEVRLTWASEVLFAPSDPGQDARHLDLLWPLWGILDLTPAGRGPDWYPKL